MIRAGLSFVQKAISDLFFPRICTFCDSSDVAADANLCDKCRNSIRFVSGHVCSVCGSPAAGFDQGKAAVCGRCLTQPPRYRKARYGTYYEGPLREALVRFKYQGALHAGQGLSELLIQSFHRHYAPSEFDIIVAVPIHRNRLISRGFNQSMVLAQRLSSETGIRLDRFAVEKIKDTPPQVGLPRPERIRNLKESFGISNPAAVRDWRVLLVDDVGTTGSTIAECAKTIATGKAARVDVLVLALRSDNIREDVPEPVAQSLEYGIT